MSAQRLRLVVGIPTYQRPEKLAELLSVLPERIAEMPEGIDVGVVVADNDPSGSARTVVDQAPLSVRYVREPHPGIGAVRNRLIDTAGDARLLAFIDDDERPLEGWLPALVETWRTHRADAVMGRVISVFEAHVDPWLIESGVFRRRERPTGMPLRTAAAGNLLIDLDSVNGLGLRFDEGLGLAGGEDTLFSKQLIAGGGHIVWCNESRAEDFVPEDRLTRRWAMKRAFSGGNAAVEISLKLERRRVRRAFVRVKGVAGGAARLLFGSARHLWGRLRGDLRTDARGLRMAYRGRGMLARALGHRHQEYARTEAALR